MALDRCVAICHPLLYTEMMTSHLLGLIATFALTWSLGLAVSLVVLTATARFFRTSVTQHFTCEYIALLNIACGDLTFNNRLGLAMRLVTMTFDLTLLGTSYTRIIYAAFQISSGGARAKALHTCGSHFWSSSPSIFLVFLLPLSFEWRRLCLKMSRTYSVPYTCCSQEL